MLAAIGHGGLKEGQVLNKLMEAFDKEHKRELTDREVLEAARETKAEIPVNKSKGGITVHGIHDVAVRFLQMLQPHSGR